MSLKFEQFSHVFYEISTSTPMLQAEFSKNAKKSEYCIFRTYERYSRKQNGVLSFFRKIFLVAILYGQHSQSTNNVEFMDLALPRPWICLFMFKGKEVDPRMIVVSSFPSISTPWVERLELQPTNWQYKFQGSSMTSSRRCWPKIQQFQCSSPC